MYPKIIKGVNIYESQHSEDGNTIYE